MGSNFRAPDMSEGDPTVVLPGDLILEYDPEKTQDRIFLGPGLRWQDKTITATKCGLLRKTPKKIYFVDSQQKRYVPEKRDFVLGIILKKRGDFYMIDIGASMAATISYLSFENASKKTRTELDVGDLIYGKLIVANKHMDPELVCIDSYDRAVGMGRLPDGGILFTVPLHVARLLIKPDNPFLHNISKKVTYTIVVGLNGRVWVKTAREGEMVAVMNAILLLEVMSEEEANKKVLKVLESFI
ncbi:hypothetical protein Pcinc_004881 [Petrolisthes cinctipes]|uniref:Ribosomal RNA-processing protein 40 n=1 Tax=Petrolisthes cinctipes TaxID=88211 RepID=A0AAE1GG02_PETCI|nr:hypothetical protein Pcinc_004881 [Petrolisthes cinctipes]